MKTIIILAALIAVALAASVDPKNAKVVSYENDNGATGYKFGYEIDDGSSRVEQGELKNVGSEDEYYAVRGSYSFVAADDGKTYKVDYVADQNGFQAEGAHLPKV